MDSIRSSSIFGSSFSSAPCSGDLADCQFSEIQKMEREIEIGKLLKNLLNNFFSFLVYFALNRYNGKLTMVSMEAFFCCLYKIYFAIIF